MTSIQDALTEALEHPITEPRARVAAHRKWKRRPTGERSREVSEPLLWGIAGVLLAFGLYGFFAGSKAS